MQLKNEIQYSDLTNIKYLALARRCSNWVACTDSLTEIIFYYLQLRVTGEFTVLKLMISEKPLRVCLRIVSMKLFSLWTNQGLYRSIRKFKK